MPIFRVLTTALVLLFGPYATAAPVTVSISCGAVGIELDVCRQGAQIWAERTGNEIQVVSTPNASNERLALYQQLLATGSPDIDVFQIDVIWPGILHQHFIDLAAHVEPGSASHFPVLMENNRVQDRLVALPWFVDAGLLYYRKDLLNRHGKPVPRTWQELTETAAAIQQAERAAGNDRLWGYVFQGRAYEGLTCNALEWIDSHGGGTIVDADGTITVNNPRARAALELAASWVGGIAPPGVLNYDEEQSRGAFHSGHAVFMRNWPYAWPLLEAADSPLRDRVGVAPLPSGSPDGPRSSTLGGWHLSVSRYSQVQDEAIDLVRFLTSLEEQRRRALEAGFHPTYPELYEDPDVLAASPAAALLIEVLPDAVARPSDVLGVRYNQASSAFWNAAHAVLAGRRDAEQSLTRLERELERLARRRGR